MRCLALGLMVFSGACYADITRVALDQDFTYRPAGVRVRVVDNVAGSCKSPRRVTVYGCYVGYPWHKITIKRDYSKRWMESVGAHECNHHAFGPKHTHEDYQKSPTDPFFMEKMQGFRDCMVRVREAIGLAK